MWMDDMVADWINEWVCEWMEQQRPDCQITGNC